MATNSAKNGANSDTTNNDARKRRKTTTKKPLSRKEKLEAVRKANAALMKAWELMSQRQSSETNAEDSF